nr:myotubularin [Cryptococcus depauperatus CBS 7841]
MDTLKVARVDDVILQQLVPPTIPEGVPSRRNSTGQLHLTAHHLIFSITDTSDTPEVWIPYPNIALLARLPQTIEGRYPIQLETKTFENFVFLFTRDRDGGAEDVWQSVKDCTVTNSIEQLYAFYYTFPSSGKGWTAFNPRAEFARQGLGTRTKAWRFTDINKEFSFSLTYPSKLVVPSRISDSTLSYAAKYRSKSRIPVLTYLHWANNASITRSSQPMVGLKNSRSSQDERLVECIFSSHLYLENAYSSTPIFGSTSTNLIIDARPTTNAMANVAMGAGTENMENYKLGKKAYLGIDNIHVMRNSLKIVAETIREANVKPSVPLNRVALRKSNWLRHISAILDGALIIIRNIHVNASHVLIHCSDGWDRTAQLSAVAQIALDPYFRTLEGFKVLVEKDWLAFGHKFLDRSGHLSSEKYFMMTDGDDEYEEETGGAQKAAQAFFASVQKQFSSSSHLKEISPVFHQFLDCVRQVQRQFPDRFEFNEQYLLDIYRHLYSCQFGTFLFNNERERHSPVLGRSYISRTASVWDFLDSPQERSRYINPFYDPSLDNSKGTHVDQGVLLFDANNVEFWFRLFGRGNEEMNGSPLATTQAQGDETLGLQESVVNDTIGSEKAFPAASSASQLAEPLSTVTIPWNWSQLSGNAISAVQSAAHQIRNISQDALAQIKAEAEERDNSDVRKDMRRVELQNRPVVQIPSNSNPWLTDLQAVSGSDRTIQPLISRTASNPWVTNPDNVLPSLSHPTIPSNPQETTLAGATEFTLEKEQKEQQQKQWDPLGAL